MQDLEFTVERGKLFMLQTRSAKRSAEAAVKIALDLVAEGLIDKRRAVGMVSAQSLDQLFHARIDPDARRSSVACKGLNASPGAAAGQIVFSADDAVAWKEQGRKTILVRVETDARRRARDDRRRGRADREGRRDVARGRRRARNGQAVRRGLRRAADRPPQQDAPVSTAPSCSEGDWITIDGTTGNVASASCR